MKVKFVVKYAIITGNALKFVKILTNSIFYHLHFQEKIYICVLSSTESIFHCITQIGCNITPRSSPFLYSKSHRRSFNSVCIILCEILLSYVRYIPNVDEVDAKKCVTHLSQYHYYGS